MKNKAKKYGIECSNEIYTKFLILNEMKAKTQMKDDRKATKNKERKRFETIGLFLCET